MIPGSKTVDQSTNQFQGYQTQCFKNRFFNHTGLDLKMVQPIRPGYTAQFNRSDYLHYSF